MAKIGNVALTDTFNTWRTRSNQAFDRLSQFAINNSSLYANTLTANTSFTSKGLATFNGRATVGTNLTVSGNTTLGAAGKTLTTTGTISHTGALSTTNLTVAGNTTLGDVAKTTGITGLLSITGRQTIDNNLTVSGNTTLGAAGKTLTTTGIWSHTGALSATNLTISGNTSLGGAGKTLTTTGAWTHSGWGSFTTNVTISGNTNIGGANKTLAFGGAGASANMTGWFGVTGRQTISTNLFVGANTVINGKLGIGLPMLSVDQPLHVYSSAAAANYLHMQHAGAYNTGIQFQNNQGSWYTYVSSTSNQYEIYGGTAATTKLTILPSGTVNIPLNLTVTNRITAGNTTLTGTTTDNSNALSQTLTAGATINWDVSLGRVATVTLGGNRTVAAATNQKVGTYILRVVQGGSGSYTLTWNGNFKWTAQTAPVLSTAVGAVDIFSFFSDGTKMYGSYLPDVR